MKYFKDHVSSSLLNTIPHDLAVIHFHSYSHGHVSLTYESSGKTIDYEMTPGEMNRAWDGDTVAVDPLTHEVVAIGLSAQSKPHLMIPGYLHLTAKQSHGLNKKGVPIYVFHPLQPCYPPMLVASTAAKTHPSVDHVYVLASFLEWTTDQLYPRGQCEMVIGSTGDPAADALIRAHSCGLLKGNRPLIKKPMVLSSSSTQLIRKTVEATTFSIDPEGCVDIDDALSIEVLDPYRVMIGVHIADVTAWFEYDSDIDQEAFHRGQTVYLPDTQIPILPVALSHNMCSLKPDSDRFTFTCWMVFQGGIMIDHFFEPSLIKSVAALTYDQVDFRRDDLSPAIRNSLELLERTTGMPSGNSHKLVEVLMVMANTCAAKILQKMPYDSLLRRQEVNNKGLEQDIAAEYVIAQPHASPEFTRHASLGVDVYTHFTSPIRRYADQIVHRLLRGSMFIDPLSIEHINQVQKKHRRFKRDRTILDFVHAQASAGILSIETEAIVKIRYSEKYKTYKMDFFMPSNNITYPLKFPTNLRMIVNSVLEDENTLRFNNTQTLSESIFKDEETLTVQLYLFPKEPLLYKKCVLITDRFASILH